MPKGTLSRDATRLANNRIGFGARMRLTDKIDLAAEISDGSLGRAGYLEFGYRPSEGTITTVGYRLDPLRGLDSSSFSGRDRGSLVFASTSRVNDRWSYTTESTYSAFGTSPALTSSYGVTYTPNQRWSYDGLIQYGASEEGTNGRLTRRGVSLAVRYAEENVKAGLRGEYRSDRSSRPANQLDRTTWLAAGYFETRVSEDWRFVSAIDAVISNSDQSSFRDGRYVEAKLGYAWRPVANDDLNALFSYTYLYDMPGADQVNIDGNQNGDRQRSHILNAALSWKVSPTWTIGAKYGYRYRQSADRFTAAFTTSEAHLAVLRADYHVVHNWDVMAEARMLYSPRSRVRETAALVGVYRHFGNNLRVGGGYLWGRVSDDMRRIEPAKSGLFINITSQF